MYYLRLYIKNFSGFSFKIWMIMAAVFANAAGTIATIFISLYLATKLHFSVTQIGMIMTGFGVVVHPLNIP